MWEEASAHVDGRIGLSGDRRLSLNLVANQVGVPWLLKVANQPDVPATGVLSAMGTIGGTTTRPAAMVTVQGANLAAYGEEFGSLNADVELAGREVQVSRLVIEKPQPDMPGLITATGSYHLDRRTYTADMHVRGRAAARTAAAGWRDDSRRRAARGHGHGQRGFTGGTAD